MSEDGENDKKGKGRGYARSGRDSEDKWRDVEEREEKKYYHRERERERNRERKKQLKRGLES